MPVATYTLAAARSVRPWTMLARIEGIGTFTGQYVFCTALPDYSTALYFPIIEGWPSPVSERAPRNGGAPEVGSVTIDIVDHALTLSSILRPDRGATTAVGTAFNASATTLVMLVGSSLPASNGLIFVGGEAITYTTRTTDTLTGVVRGALGTTAISHAANELVYLSNPFLKSRRLSLYMGPIDGSSSSAELLIGDFRIDTCDLSSENYSTWTIGGPSQLRFLARRMGVYRPTAVRVAELVNGGNVLRVVPAVDLGIGTGLDSIRVWTTSDLTVWLQSEDGDRGGEIVRCSRDTLQSLTISSRGGLGTKQDEIERGDVFRQIQVSDPTYGDFRVSPGSNPSESRSAGTWNRSANWVDQLLCVMTSSAHPDDGLELVNHRGTGGTYDDATLSASARSNWSSLPVGYGIGIPANQIDLTSFVAVRARTPAIDFPASVIGLRPEPFIDFARQYLESIGAFITTSSGLISLALPRIPLTSETVTEWDDESILKVLSVSYDLDTKTSITYRLTGQRGSDQSITVRAADLGLLANRGLLSTDESDESIDVPALRTDTAGLNVFLVSTAAQKLATASKAAIRIRLLLDGSQWNFAGGSLVSVTHEDLPDLETGTRGWDEVICQILEKKGPYVDEDMGSVVEYELISYSPSQVSHRVAQAAIVVSSVVTGSDREVTVAVNRHTSPDVSVLSLPVSDETQFAAADVVQEYTRAGTAVGAARAVVSTGSGTVTIAGTTAPVVGNVLATATYANQVTAQRDRYVTLGGIGTRTLDGTVAAHRYSGR